jgi:hypothetical protein
MLMAPDPNIDLQQFIDACQAAAFEYDVDTYYLVAVAGIESSGIRNIPASGDSQAFGPFQITPETWATYMAADGFNAADREDPIAQPFIAAHIAADGVKALTAVLPNNRPPSSSELYFCHLFGKDGAAVILGLPTTTKIRDALIKVYAQDPNPAARADKVIAANNSLLTVGDGTTAAVLAEVDKRLAAELKKFLPSNVDAAAESTITGQLVATASDGSTKFFVLRKVDDEVGGEFLIRQVADGQPEVLIADTTVFPIPTGIVPAAVANQLNASFKQPDPAAPVTGVAPVLPSDDINQRVEAMAIQSVGLSSKNAAGTNNGRLACAWAVNQIVTRALGKPVGGGLSTASMFAVLKSRDIAVDKSSLKGGEIVISPTTGKRVGHVGIVGPLAANLDATKIYSNSSNIGSFQPNYTIAGWATSFAKRGLPVFFFDLNKNRF